MTTTATATKTAAAVYQQLRGHLLELKLADAVLGAPSQCFVKLRGQRTQAVLIRRDRHIVEHGDILVFTRKAAHLLERDPALELLALEVDPRRLPRLEDTLRRAGVADRAQVRAADATLPALWWDGFTFDAILLDAPCSATGVVRRQPDILLHRRPEDLEALVQSQARLLDATWPLLRPGGILLYATCSILPEENVGQVEAFLARTGDAVAVPLADAFGHRAGPGRQRLPGEDGMDGFFYSRLRKAG